MLWYRVCYMYHLGKLLYISAYDGLQMMVVESKPSLQSLWFWESIALFRHNRCFRENRQKNTTIYQNKIKQVTTWNPPIPQQQMSSGNLGRNDAFVFSNKISSFCSFKFSGDFRQNTL